MAKVFFDTNCFIDLLEKRSFFDSFIFHENLTYAVSALSFHIYCYVFKKKIPNNIINKSIDFFEVIGVSREVAVLSASGPTPDYEDNLQLHSAFEAGSNYFLTRDKQLLKLGVFGKMKLVSPQEFVKLGVE